MGYLDKINSYVNDVLSNKIPSCQWVKKACERFHSDLNKGDYYFDENAVDDVISFIRKLKLNTTPKKPFLLEDWQLFIIANIYGLKSKLNNRRKYKYVYIEIPRKNGKSELITALALYHFIFDELATITVSANSREQAKNVDFKKIKSFAHQLDRREKYIIPYFNSLKMNGRQNEIIVTSSDAKRLDGLNISVGIIDELHSAKDSGVYDVIKSAMGSREEPLLIVITTAGFDVDSFCYNLRNHITDILNGVTIDESQFGIIYTLDEGDDIADENNWVKANPNLGVSLSIDFIRDEVNKAQNSPSETAGVLVKNFNLWQKKSSEKSWINEAYLEKVFAPVNIEDYRGADCMVGLDLGTNTDLTCFSICIKVQNGEYVFFTKYYLPEDSLNSATNKKRYREWAEKGYIKLTSGNVTDYDVVLNDLVGISKILNITQVNYDKYNATQFAINAQMAGIRMIPFSQNVFNYNIPTKEMERLILINKTRIDANPITHWNFTNVTIKSDLNGNVKPIKRNEELKIDGVMSMLMALGGYVGKKETNTYIV